MKDRTARVERKTTETDIRIELNLDGQGKTNDIATGIPFFDHMLTLFSHHGFFDLCVYAKGDLEVDFHHTVEDLGLALGDAFSIALSDRKGICRYGHQATPMDEALAVVTLDLSNRPFLVYDVPEELLKNGVSFSCLAKEFLRAFAVRGGITLHVNVAYGENEHHILEAVFKSLGRAMDQAVSMDARISGVRSSKGRL
ncbi:MAG: imidazoleglycerol-phosphate dehydratase HisB [Desulfobacterales bacterium]|jgi:imidazoleglycerol-phosphate dehydratase|nr:imidazoleglycerol-phosphate dehydratase HisB [Desulfobacterales bacterium]